MPDPLQITSRQNPRVKEAAQLRVGRERQRSGRFIIDGARETARAIASGIRCVEVFICEELCRSPEAVDTVRQVSRLGIHSFVVSREVYAKLAFGDRKDGVVAVAEDPRRTLTGLKLPEKPLVAVLEGIEKPGNLGAIMRSADAAGVDALIVADGGTDLFNPNTIRASLGTVFRDHVCQATTAATMDWLRLKELKIVAARVDADTPYTAVDYDMGIAIVLGSEAEGLTEAWHAKDVTPIKLPMRGLADSLNVSTTAAILFYEALRQRSLPTS